MLCVEIRLLPDQTFFIQLGIFLVVLTGLHFLVFKPLIRILRYRFEKTDGDRKKIEELTQKTQKLMAEYEAKIAEARRDAHEIKEAIRKEGLEQANELMKEAKASRQKELGQIRQEVARATLEAEGSLKSHASAIGKEIAEKVLHHGH